MLRESCQQESENLKVEKGLLLEVREGMVFMNLQDRREGKRVGHGRMCL